jgi:CRP-like cAMP-binding protein
MDAALNFSANRILGSLPSDELASLASHLKETALKAGTVLQEDGVEIDNIYFPTAGMISVLIATSSGDLIETALVGKEGVLNSFAGIGVRQGFNRAIMQVSGSAFRIETAAFVKALQTSPKLRSSIDRYHAFLLVQSQQTAACNLLHPIESRLCRWLSQVRDRVETNSFDLTQEFVAQMLGVSRPTVNLALSQLKAGNLIQTHRRAIEIVDVEGMEAAACECYALLKDKMKDII